MMCRPPLLAFLLVIFSRTACSQNHRDESAGGTYTVVAPAKLRPNLAYHVSVSIHQASSPVDMLITIAGRADNGNHNNITKAIRLSPHETRIINLDIGEWGPGNYNLSVRGTGGLEFRNETALTFEHKSYSVFVQTDKAIYKPGQLVRFRAIVVNPYLVPTVTGALNMYITDGAGNRVKQWKRVFTNRGIVSADFRLSDQPVLGDWTIHVDVLGQIFKKTFTVAEYVLPTFYVEVDLPSYATYNNSDVVATVRATYTYGKPVKGEVTLSVAPQTRYNFLSVRPYETYQTKTQIDGSVDIALNLAKDLNLKTDFFEREIEFFALVEEGLTGRKYNKTNTMKIYDKDIKVELIKTSDTFKPGLKYICFLKVAYQDNTPVDDSSGEPLKLYSGYTYDDKSWAESLHPIPRNGLIKLEFFPPKNAETVVLGLRAEYKKQMHYLESVDAASSPSMNFIQVIMLMENPKVGEEAYFEVNATEPIGQLVIQIMGRGDIVFARTYNLDGLSTFRSNFAVTDRMAPKARLLVYYLRKENEEVVADAVNFEVDGVFRTPVKVATDVKETMPGKQVSVMVTTTPNAYVGVLGIDQSTLLLKSGNDITQQDVIKELETYDGGKSHKYWPPWYRRRKRSIWWPGSATAAEIFKDSGVVILTNGVVHSFEPYIFYRMNPVQFASPVEDDPNDFRPSPEQNSAKNKNDEPGSIKLRKHFPETWLWNLTTAGQHGDAAIISRIPDTITSWIVSAFAMDQITGLGIAPETAKVTVFRPFFVKMNLPYSVIRGESVAVQVVVFNYLNKPIKAEVTLENKKKEFDFTVAGNDGTKTPIELKEKTKIVSVPAQDGASVSFLITPRRLGYIDIKVSALSNSAGDAVLKKLLVKPEGTPQYFNKAFLLDLRVPSSSGMTSNISVPIPNNAIPGSERITVSAIGDVLGPSINNLDQLLRMPFGCGEQNMLNFVPNIVVLEYLSRANRLTHEIQNKALQHMEKGYQRELTYKRDDGSFSAFGKSDTEGSTWLTAFVVKAFHQAKPHIDIDDNVTTQAIQWLVNSQNSDGSFTEKGEIHNKAMQGGSGSGISLTAYVLIALLENRAQVTHPRPVDLAHEYLERNLETTNDPYVVTIATYALHLMNSQSKEAAYRKMMSLAKRNGDMLYWSKSSDNKNVTDKQSDHFYLPASVDVEMTSYALLTHMVRADVNGALPIMKWLVSQQNEKGGFASTQDTVIGIQALGELAARIVSQTINIDVAFNYEDGRAKALKINSDNAMVLQRVELPSSIRSVEIESKGFGVAVVQVSWSYNLAVSAEQPAFFLNALLDKTSTENYLQLSVCTRNREDIVSNMAVMEVVLPSGYLADVDALPSIRQTDKVKRVETKDGDTNVVIYFDRIAKKELCVTVPAHRTFKVANQKPVPVKVYDYYNLAKSARLFYHPHEATVCSICEGDDCGDGCNVVQTEQGPETGGGAAYLSMSAPLVTLAAIIGVLGFRRLS